MMFNVENVSTVKNTTHKVVLPFYLFAACSFMAATLLLFFSSGSFTGHYFHPHILSITHMMALGWGTMIILGAGHQLVPVLTESRLFSIKLAFFSFLFAAAGIPLLVYGFYVFDMGWLARSGGWFIVLAILCFVVNLAGTVTKSKTNNVHAVFVFTASLWLLLTAALGLALIYNFTVPLFSTGSLALLPLHAHMGIVGWFLLLVIGVGSRLIPMFLISKYSNVGMLWLIYLLINGGLLLFLLLFLYLPEAGFYFVPLSALLAALVLFGYYCHQCYGQRIRKKVDEQMRISLFSVIVMLLPMLILIVIVSLLMMNISNNRYVLVYGFIVFFGWITGIILGMTFKTLPFIVWNKVYHIQAANGKTPNPADLFSHTVFKAMSVAYLAGILVFSSGILLKQAVLIKSGSACLIVTAFLYNWNTIKLIRHKKITT